MAWSSALPLHVRGAFSGGHYSCDKSRLARSGKITDVLFDTCCDTTLSGLNIRAIRFDIDSTRPRTRLCQGGRYGNEEQCNPKRQN
jgi:hypothetical protein